jgi:ribulose-phosphate 3-epimerase
MAALHRLQSLCPTLSVGTLAADLMDLGAQLSLVEQAGVGIVHVDVMDGVYCPLLTVGPGYVKGLRTSMLKDVHLMIREPLDSIPAYVAAGADIITVQVESAVHIHRVLQRLGTLESVREPGTRIVRGLALEPGTSLDWLDAPLLDEVEMISILGVDPGWSGQKMAPRTLARLTRVKQIIADSGRDILTCVDGGITKENIAQVAAAGPDLIVAGSAVFDGKAPAVNAQEMLRVVREAASGSALTRHAGTISSESEGLV